MADANAYDLIVIGAGPGGYAAAIRAAQLGMRVACVEKEALGGTCLNVGCIPSKALLESSELFEQAKRSFERHGIRLGEVTLDLAGMMARKDRIVQTMNRGIGGLFRKNRVAHVRGTARLAGAGAVEVQGSDGAEVLHAAHVLIATGSAPIPLPGLSFDGTYVVGSTEALSFPETPERLAVIGAGAIGLELGSVWNRLGSRVLVVELLDRILPGMDLEMASELKGLLERQGLTFQMETRAGGAEVRDRKVHLTLVSGAGTREEVCDRVLVAVGRRPHTEGLGVKEAGIALDERGRIAVDAHYRTSLPGVWAIGDVIAGPMLAHKAEEEGVAAVERMAGRAGHVDYGVIPNVVYTHPELASVGVTEEEAQERGMRVRVGRFPFRANGRAHCLDATEGLVKMISDEKTDRLLGMHILGARASEMIAEGVTAMAFSASAEDLARTVHAHPTLAETIKEAALAVEGRGIHI